MRAREAPSSVRVDFTRSQPNRTTRLFLLLPHFCTQRSLESACLAHLSICGTQSPPFPTKQHHQLQCTAVETDFRRVWNLRDECPNFRKHQRISENVKSCFSTWLYSSKHSYFGSSWPLYAGSLLASRAVMLAYTRYTTLSSFELCSAFTPQTSYMADQEEKKQFQPVAVPLAEDQTRGFAPSTRFALCPTAGQV